jgi:hypothetical protein
MLRIICFAEAAADARVGSGLGDRLLAEEGPDWVDAALLPHLRVWTGLEMDQPYTKWTDLKDKYRQSGRPRYLGHSTSGYRGSGHAMAAKALILAEVLAGAGTDALVVVMLSDCDASEDKRAGLRQATEEPRFASLSAVVGIANKMREAWVLNGFLPQSDAETQILRRLTTELSFDPTQAAERLRAAKPSEARHPKRVLSELTGDDLEREERCWLETPLDELRRRGAGTGLTAFLDELRERLTPLMGR